MTIDILNKLNESGELESLVNAGIISVNVKTWIKVRNSYTMHLQQGLQKTAAIQNTAETFSISERSVYRMLKMTA